MQKKNKENIASLNLGQGLAHKFILQCVVGNEEKGKLFFINVPGRYGCEGAGCVVGI